jgi:hypothetical protein
LFKKFINLWIQFKIKKSSFLEFFHFNFLYNLKTFDVVGFLTPHGSQIATTVAILSPALPQRGELKTESLNSIFKKCRFASPQGGQSLKLFQTCRGVSHQGRLATP